MSWFARFTSKTGPEIIKIKGRAFNLALTVALLLVFSSCSYIKGKKVISDPKDENQLEKAESTEKNSEDTGEKSNQADSDQEVRILALAEERKGEIGEGNYLLGPGDVIKISVFDLDEMNKTVKVSEKGWIMLPLVGEVLSSNMTAEELKTKLEVLLGSKYLVDPQVEIFVEEYNSQRIAVIGRVEKPNIYPLSRKGSRILDLLGQAGGPAKEAGRKVYFYPSTQKDQKIGEEALKIASTINPKEIAQGKKPITAGLERLMNPSDPLANLHLRNGDIIYVPDKGDFFVGGEVRSPGKYEISEETTLISAISQAGGLGEYPEEDEILLIREEEKGKKKSFELDYEAIVEGKAPDIPVLAGDQVIVPKNRLKSTFFTIIDVLGRFIGIGIPII